MSVARTIVGLSGGVDSSVAAIRLLEQGEPIAGLFMQNWEDDGSGECRAEDDRRDAVAVAARLGIPIHFRNFSSQYWEGVFEHFLAEYARGRTPNPDVLCNREIKFKYFLDAAQDLGADYIATGHYARVRERDGRYELLRAIDTSKDQTYFLHQLGQHALAQTRFPLGDLLKTTVREMAANANLPTAAKKDSTGICFIGERDFRTFLSQYLPVREGEMQTPNGQTIGTHPGVFFYTLGQREGLHIGGVKGFPQAPWFVVGKDVPRNVLIVDQLLGEPLLDSSRLQSEPMHWIAGEAPAQQFRCHAQIRHLQPPQACEVSVHDDGSVDVVFDTPQRAVTPGQSLVLYDQEICLGGGVIDSSDAPLHSQFLEPNVITA